MIVLDAAGNDCLYFSWRVALLFRFSLPLSPLIERGAIRIFFRNLGMGILFRLVPWEP